MNKDPWQLEDDDILEPSDYRGPLPETSPARAQPDQVAAEALAAKEKEKQS